jgi:hypothetical protein
MVSDHWERCLLHFSGTERGFFYQDPFAAGLLHYFGVVGTISRSC